jgi:hypothetical protein
MKFFFSKEEIIAAIVLGATITMKNVDSLKEFPRFEKLL